MGSIFNPFFSNAINDMKVVSLMVSSKFCVVYTLYVHNCPLIILNKQLVMILALFTTSTFVNVEMLKL